MSEAAAPAPAKSAKASTVAWGPVAALGIGALAFIGSQFIIGFIGGMLSLIFGFSLESVWGEAATPAVRLLAVAALAAVSVGIVYAFVRRRGGWRALGLYPVAAKQYLYLVPAIVAYVAVLVAAMSLIAALLPGIDLDQDQDVGFTTTGDIELLAAGIALIIIAPISEEILFRGFVFRGLLKRLSWPIAAVISSGLFALAHLQLNVGIDTFILGIAACWLVVRTNSILPAILLHAIKNAIAFTIVFIIGV